MKKKLLCFTLVLFMIFGYSTQALPNKVYAEMGESFYSVEKLANEDSSNVQIQLNVDEDIVVNQVVYPDESITVEDLTQYTYSVDQNDTYAFTISYTDSETQEVKEEKVTVDVTEIVEPQVDEQEASGSETTVQQQPTVEETTPSQKADVAFKAAENSLDVVYVSASGNDETGEGTQDNPVATLSKAVDVVKDGGKIILTSNLTVNKLSYISSKTITIDGNGYTVTRSNDFIRAIDLARGGYNSAMIEVANSSKLILENITLNDNYLHEGTKYELQHTGDGEKGNEEIVQDGIIASYGDGKSTIILGKGATLKNFGGLAAIYITGDEGAGANLIMQEGSKICDDNVGSREGGYAAIYNHGGTVTVDKGASIENIDGRAIYADNGADTTVNGIIQNITSNTVMKQSSFATGNGFAGIAYYGDGHTAFTLGGEITHLKIGNGKKQTDVALHLISCDFTMTEGSKIQNIEKIGIADINGARVKIAGSVTNCNTENVLFRLRGTMHTFILEETGLIENCSTTDAGIIYLNMGTPTIEIKGTINNVQVGRTTYAVIFLSKNGVRSDIGTVTLTSTGKITNVTKGIAILASENAKVSIAGEISDCNSYALEYETYKKSMVEISKGAKISGTSGIQITTTKDSGPANNSNQHVTFNAGAVIEDKIDLPAFDVNLDIDYTTVKFGIPSATAKDALTKSIKEQYNDWNPIGNPIWFQPSENEIHFTATRPIGAKLTGLFAAYIPLKEDGTPVDNAKAVFKEVVNDSSIDVSLDGLTVGQSYALMFVNNNQYTLNPDDITIYTGGGQGTETSTTGFPEYTLTDTLDSINTLTIDGEDTSLKGNEALDELQKYLTITYTDDDGNVVTNDREAGKYTATLTWKDPTVEIRINGNEVDVDEQGGTVIVRHTSDKEGAISGTTTHELVKSEPTEKVTHATAMAKSNWILDPEFYTNNDENRQVSAEGIQLLDDSLLLEDENDNRQELMENEAKKFLKIEDELGTLVHFDFHYLDLVDVYNGNAWVSASNGTTVYLPYPEGLNKTKAEELGLKVVHYKDLHREYGITGQENVEEAIKNCELEVMENVIFEENYIQFDVPRSGFSPFALVWSEHTGTGKVTINYKDADTGEELREARIHEFTIGEDYDVSQSASKLGLKGYHIDRVDGIENEVGTMQGDVTITVWYKNDAPVIKADDVTIHVGDEFDPYDYVEVSDREWNVNDWGNIIDHLKVESNVDVNKAGVYTVTYSITDCTVDNRGTKTTTKTIKVTVLDDSDPMEPTDPKDPINPGDNDNNKPTDDSKDPDIVVDVKPDKSTETTPDKTTESTEVKTGDTSPIMIYALGAGISLAAIAYMVIRRRRDM